MLQWVIGIAKGTVHIVLYHWRTYLELFCSEKLTMDKNVIGKRTRKRLGFSTLFVRLQFFFDLDFPLKSFWTGPPGEILPSSSRAHIRK